MKRLLGGLLVFALWMEGPLFAQNPPKPTPPDNTNVNKRDRNSAQPTAGQQKENRSDLEITRQIRRSLTQDKSLSTYAKNVKVITQNGNVTLRGPVRSEEEKKSVEAKANDVAGADHVKNEIEIAKPATKSTR
jgi:hyperosmotically inducible periplasmic protein